MSEQDKIQLFENQKIRTAWDTEKEVWYFSVTDVIAVLTEQPTARGASNYWAKLKQRLKELGLDKEPESLAAEPVQEITVQEPEPVSAPDNGSVPDPAISVESMNAYGYTDSNMLPLTKERALELMERDVTVYMLHTDNTEAMAFDADEIRSFDGIFGVEASEWGTVKDRFVPQDYEKAFLDNPADSFAIYQLRDNDDTVQLHYMNSEYLEKKGLSIQKEN